MRRNVVAIVNPVSGQGGFAGAVQRVGEILNRHGCTMEVRKTSGPGHGTEIAREVAGHAEAVLAVGGDGTVNEIVNGLLDAEVPLAILGAGTENLLARYLCMPSQPSDLAHLLLFGRARPFDAARLNDRLFLAVAGFGFDGECVHRLAAKRKGHITHLDYFWPVWRTFWSYRFPSLLVVADGKSLFRGPALVFVGVINRYGGGLQLLPRARHDDGLLDVCVIPCSGHFQLLRHGIRVLLRRHIGRGGTIYERARAIRISANEYVAVQIDGEADGSVPASISILPAALQFLARSDS